MQIKTAYLNLEGNKPYKPLLIFSDVNKQLIEKLKQEINIPVCLIYFTDIDWDKDFSIWPYDKFLGGGDNTIKIAIETITNLDNVSKDIYVAGYSLGGLLGLYMTSKCENVIACACMSGSLWYPDFVEYLSKVNLKNRKLFFSLGDKESKSRHPLMKTVDEKTSQVIELLNNGNDVHFEYSQGNHFSNVEGRIITGIQYIIK